MSTVGGKLDRYQILEPLGKGGMGEVFLALDTVLERKVAIKFLANGIQEDPQALKRFQREAKSAAALDHPYICKVYETGNAAGKAFLVMEYVAGETLRDRLDRGPLPLQQSLQIAYGIAEALEEAHEKGIVHRDLKPANIILTPKGHPKIMDFGLAKQVTPLADSSSDSTVSVAADLTTAGTLLGTIAYMSPEQARGEAIDTRSDIFSFGMVLYEMLSGRHPFQRASQVDTLGAITRDAPPPLQVQNAANPKLRGMLDKALAKNPADRYQRIGDLASEIRDLKAQLERSSLLSHKWILAAAAVIAVAVLVLAGLKLIPILSTKTKQTALRSISLIVADTENRSGDSSLDGVLEQLLSISLGGAEHISLFERKEAINLVNRLDPGSGGRISAKNSRLLCQREGINLAVQSSIEKDGSGFRIKAVAVDAVSGKAIATADRAIQAKTDILKAADYLSSELRSQMGFLPAGSDRAMRRETFTTTSLDAMTDYAEAQQLAAVGKEKEAADAYLRAIGHDPNFGRAYAGLAVSYYDQGEWQLAERYYKEALDRIDQMTDREKHRTRGGYYIAKQNYRRAAEEYLSLVRAFPEDMAGHEDLALAYFMGYKMAEAFQEGLRAVQLDPDNLNYRYNQSWYALASGDFAKATEEARKTLQINPSYPKALVVLALSDLANEQNTEAMQKYRQLEAMNKFGASLAACGLADLAIYEGRLQDAVTILNKGIDADLQNKSTGMAAHKLMMLAQAYSGQGKKGLVLETAEKACKTNGTASLLFASALLYLDAGSEGKARKIAEELGERIQEIDQVYGKLVVGYVFLKKGDAAKARKSFEEAQSVADTWLGRFALGRAYLEGGAFPESYSEFEKCEKRKGEALSVFLNDLPTFRYLDKLYYFLGRAQEGQGSKGAAKQSYEKFLNFKPKPDPGDALIADARRRLAKVSSDH